MYLPRITEIHSPHGCGGEASIALSTAFPPQRLISNQKAQAVSAELKSAVSAEAVSPEAASAAEAAEAGNKKSIESSVVGWFDFFLFFLLFSDDFGFFIKGAVL